MLDWNIWLVDDLICFMDLYRLIEQYFLEILEFNCRLKFFFGIELAIGD